MPCGARPLDADLLRLGLVETRDLHPLVAAAIADGTGQRAAVDGWRYGTESGIGAQYADVIGSRTEENTVVLVRCGAGLHRVARVGGCWQPIDHDDHASREALLQRLGGPVNLCRSAVQHLGSGRQVMDAVARFLDHGRVAEAARLLEAHADSGQAPGNFILADGGTVGERLAVLREHTLWLRMIRAGAPPTLEPPNARVRYPRTGTSSAPDRRSRRERHPPVPKGGTGPTQEAQVIMTLTTLPAHPTPTPPAASPAPGSQPDAAPGPREQLRAADRLIALARAAGTAPGSDPSVAALALATAANLPVLLWGQPGIGKSSTLTELARGLGLPLETVIASVHEPSDFSGLPVLGSDPAGQGVAMAPPDWAVRLRRVGDGLLFLDELSSAPPAVQAALLRVVLERRVGSLALPDGVRIVAAANPPGSAADGWQLAPPLANRFIHLDWACNPAVVVRGLGGTWPRVPLPRLDPARLTEAVDPVPRSHLRVPDGAARLRAPDADLRHGPLPGLALTAHLGDGAATAGLRLRGGRRSRGYGARGARGDR